ncbi:MAG TPA: patatin-like phospholipase family protein [bacterium]|nr:patatin-like phospholipase family protein [bacterium]
MTYPEKPLALDPGNLSRFIARVKDPDTHFAVSLGSGATLALASSLSILQTLDDLGLRGHVDEVWGASSGALAAGLWCSGTPVAEVMALLRRLRRRDLVDVAWGHILKGLFTRRWDLDLADGLVNGRALIGRVRGLLRVELVEDCPVRLRILLAHDDGSARIKVVKRGSLLDAIRSSIAMQGVMRPGWFEGERFVDPTLLEKTPLPSVTADFRASGSTKKKLLILAAFFGYHGQTRPIRGLMSRIFFFKEVLQYQVFLAHLTAVRHQPGTDVIVYSPCIHDVDTLAVEQADEIFSEVRRQMAVRLSDECLDADIHKADPDVWVPRWCPSTLFERDEGE